jgi:VanZ family protein
MNGNLITGSNARLRSWLAAGYALFIVYGSLSPFSGWRSQGMEFIEMLEQPFRLTYTTFDAVLNVLSYLPLGLLVGTALRARFGALSSVALGLLVGVTLSATMEYLQMYLPTRISSNMDLLSNGIGTLMGVLMAVRITSWPWLLDRLTHWRSVLFQHGKEMDFGLALLMLWMFGQVNPSLPMLGNVFISEVARQPFAVVPAEPFDGWESVAVTLKLLLTLLRESRNVISALMVVLGIVAIVKFTAATVLLRSWALLLWINSEAVLGILLGMMLLVMQLWFRRKMALGFGAAVALSYLAIVNLLFEDNTPSSAMSVYHWHYGHLLNYNGLAQTITLVFPVLLLFHLWRIRKV